MKNKLLAFVIFSCLFAVGAEAQQSSVNFNKKGVSVIFKIETTSPDASKQSFGSVYFTGYDETEKQSRVHRVIGDKTNGVYFGYDLIIETDAGAPNKFKVSFKPLSKNPPEQMRLIDTAIRSLPKYPEDMIVEDGDTIALDILFNPQTKVKIVDLIKITSKKTQSPDSTLFDPTATSSGGTGFGVSVGSGTSDGLFSKKKTTQDYTLNDVKLRLTSPKLFVNGTVSSIRGSEWNGVIEGSVIFLYIPGKGRFVFSLFPRENLSFRKDAVVENNKITFQSDGERYELISAAPIVRGNGGNWNMWILNDAGYKPDLTFSAESADYLQYGAADEAENLLARKPRQMRQLNSNSSAQSDKKAVYQKWLDEDVRYIATDAEKQTFSGLNTNEEREQFIESFWQRRDDKPETKENEFRREYYNRIAYANQNFVFGEISGSRTDRGRIFITYGKPDEIQKNTSEEIWIYKPVPRLRNNLKFEFVDTSKNGDFRLRQ